MKIVNLESIFLVFVGTGSISISVIPKQKALNRLLRMVLLMWRFLTPFPHRPSRRLGTARV